jgi:valyl-tRNA synthetase
MAYYTVAHLLQVSRGRGGGGGDISRLRPHPPPSRAVRAQGGDINPATDGNPGPLGIRPEHMTHAAWDFVFQDGPYPADCGAPESALAALRAEFRYWYPMDLRVSGKDLVFNHLTMALYNHAAMWPATGADGKLAPRADRMPQGYFCNGHVMVDGEKMAKSLGNFIMMQVRWRGAVGGGGAGACSVVPIAAVAASKSARARPSRPLGGVAPPVRPRSPRRQFPHLKHCVAPLHARAAHTPARGVKGRIVIREVAHTRARAHVLPAVWHEHVPHAPRPPPSGHGGQEAVDRWGADATRFTISDSGDGLDDANFERPKADAAILRLTTEVTFVADNVAAIKEGKLRPADSERNFVDM